MENTNQYLSLNLGTIEIKQQSRQSIYRHWNRLHRLQKTIIVLLLVLLALYILTHIQFHQSEIKKIPTHHEHAILKKILKPEIKINDNEFEKIDIPPDQQKNDQLDKQSKESGFKLDIKPDKDIIDVEKKPLKFKGPTNQRQQSVVDAFKHAWMAYKKHSWGQDELKPISKTAHSWFNLGLTIVDSLDTIYIMNLQEIFQEARDWVKSSLHLNVNRYNNLFEITIRIMGGLISAYHLSADRLFLNKAYDLGNRSLPAFDTRSHIPFSDINLSERKGKSPFWTTDSSISEVATLQLEFKELTYLTGDDRFKNAVSKVSEKIHKLDKPNGLVPIYISTTTGKFIGRTITLGARGDSYYEYLLKQWIQTGASFDRNHENFYLLEDWLKSVRGVRDTLVRQTKPNNLYFIGESLSGSFSPKMDHLVCFYPGNLALGAAFLKTNQEYKLEAESMMKLAEDLTETCYQMYAQMETGLSPEIAHFNINEDSTVLTDLYVKDADRHNLLRPETVETLYYMYKITGKQKYQEYGWKIFQAFEKYTKIKEGGYTSIDNVRSTFNTRPKDKMESFFLAETLKYLYLLFEDQSNQNFDLTKWVINTEAHFVPVHY